MFQIIILILQIIQLVYVCLLTKQILDLRAVRDTLELEIIRKESEIRKLKKQLEEIIR